MKIGTTLLSAFAGLNMLVAIAGTVIIVSGKNAPALTLTMSPAEIARLDPKVVAVVNAQAALANPCIVSLCVLVLALTWNAVVERSRWAVAALAGSLLPLQAFGFISDSFLGNRNLLANIVSATVLVAGLGFTALACAGHPPQTPRQS